MAVNAQQRTGAQCKAGDTVTVLMAVDEDECTVEVPGYLEKIIAGDAQARKFWPKLSFTSEGICAGDPGREKTRDPGKAHRVHDGRAPPEPAQEVTAILSTRRILYRGRLKGGRDRSMHHPNVTAVALHVEHTPDLP